VAWLVQVARGHSGGPYDWLAAIGGLAYLLAVAFFRWRGWTLMRRALTSSTRSSDEQL